MIKEVITIAAFWILTMSFTQVFSQEDSTLYINGLPVSEDDTARQVPHSDLEPKNDLTVVTEHALPDKLRTVLENETQYRGWRDTSIYLQKNTGIYLVPIKTEKSVKIFGLNESGNPVTFSEVSGDRDD